MATLRGNEVARPASIFGAPASRRSLSPRLVAPLSSLAAALSLTSKQRFLSEDILRSIVPLLRHTADQVEAAALLAVMADPVASEYIMTSAGRPDEHTASTVGVSMPAVLFGGDAEKPAMSSLSSSGSGGDGVSDVRMHSSMHPTRAQSTESLLRHPSKGSEGLLHAPSLSASSSSPLGTGPQRGNSSSNVLRIHARPCPNGSKTPVEQAIHAASAAVSSPLYTYNFPEKWFGNSTDMAAPHAAQNTASCILHSTGAGAASVTIPNGFKSLSQTPASFSGSTFTSVSPAVASRSPSLGTAVFSPVLPTESRSVPAMGGTAFIQAGVKPAFAAATAQPPLFFDNQLLDPTTNRCLFGGHAFREEARVLQVPAADASLLMGSGVGGGKRGDHFTRRPHGSSSPTLLLVREYVPISAECGIAEDEPGPLAARGGGADAVFVQCFSLLPRQPSQICPNEYRLLPETAITACLLVALPGCVTIVTPLDAFLCDTRHSLLKVAESSLERLLGQPQEAGKRACEWRSTGGSSYITSEIPSTSPTGVRGSHASSSLEAAEKNRDDVRIAVVRERLAQRVLPEVLDEALHAVRSSLVVYCIRYEQRRHMRVALDAVHTLQRFFRRCLAVKERAVQRMVRQWRRLEIDARLKLQRHQPPPAAVERMYEVANSILQEHMYTSQSYKRAFIQDQWEQRRRAFAKWREQEEWNSVFASAMLPKRSGLEGSVTDVAAEKRRCSVRLTADAQLRLESEFNKRRDSSNTTMLLRPVPHSSSAAAETYADREQAAIHRFLSWYIDPHELLYLSHQCLLESLKNSVFGMVEVQLQLKRAARGGTKEDSKTPLTGSMSCSSVPQQK
ncbi:hypothetical protein GH5_02291 [Leishmania sp. Ghana 2012 LV757]|uniref:hypothetical protein n=1 Tax=Leishmania sp. Ghana 2012 LV757 TaxID=2803181 RepID=UPI001B499174|nr:hypothetical protein GH5_02291 [Leishmania sp. Ghana 2012 LV757]